MFFSSSSDRSVYCAWVACALLAIPSIACDESGDFLLRVRRTPPATGHGARLVAAGAGIPRTLADLDAIATQLESEPRDVVDGTVVDLGFSQQFLTSRALDVASTEADAMAARLADAPFDRLRHSILRVESRPGDIDWRDADHVAVMTANLAEMARRAREAGLSGFFFDTQTYERNVFSYPDIAQGETFEALERIVYDAARTIFAATFAAYPTMQVLLTLGYSEAWREVCVEGIPIDEARYGLLPAFLRGLTEEAERTGATVVDGFLPAYPVKTVRAYDVLFAAIRGDDDVLRASWVPGIVTYRWPRFPSDTGERAWPETYMERCDAESRSRVRRGLPAGMAVMLDYGIFEPESFQTDPARFGENPLTPAELRALLARTLEEADGYVWMWSGHVDFFGGADRGLVPLPAEYRDAILQARVVIPSPASPSR